MVVFVIGNEKSTSIELRGSNILRQIDREKVQCPSHEVWTNKLMITITAPSPRKWIATIDTGSIGKWQCLVGPVKKAIGEDEHVAVHLDNVVQV